MRPANIKEQRQKEVRRIHKEQHKIWDKIEKLPLIKLEKPIRHGWYKEIVLTENLERYKSQSAVEEIFKILNTYFWGRTKKECEEQWDCQRSKHFIYRDVPTISKKQFNKLSTKAQALCTPFQYREKKKLKVRFYVRIPVNTYRVKFTRAYNTHRKLLDPNLESRSAFLDNRLRSPELFELDPWNTFYRREIDYQVKKSRRKSRQELRKYRNTSSRSKIE